MNMTKIRNIAVQQGVDYEHMNKQDLVRAIQRSENNWDCFATAYNNECNQVDCCWSQDCFTMTAKSSIKRNVSICNALFNEFWEKVTVNVKTVFSKKA
ncbi:MAG: hypothetical protein JKX75_05115 [Gammaproteobacteria bacterium]|nr:hypothetical protein [Gammaproteobacteria bacterium]